MQGCCGEEVCVNKKIRNFTVLCYSIFEATGIFFYQNFKIEFIFIFQGTSFVNEVFLNKHKIHINEQTLEPHKSASAATMYT